MNRITMMSVMAALALIMSPGFTAQAASTSPDIPATSSDIETPDTEAGDDVGEVEVADVEDVDVGEVEDMDVAEVGDVETPEVEAPELGE